MGDATLASKMGAAGRQRAVREFGWPAIASRTAELYRALLSGAVAQGETTR
jgi:starch synthase